jgi:DNA-binding NarL/FixJ family response regulator
MAKVIPIGLLTLPERTFLDRLARGWDYTEIARHMETNQNTLAVMSSTLINKLQVKTIYQAIAYAVYHGLIFPCDTPAVMVKTK